MKANELRIGNYISNQDGTLNNIPIGEPHIVNETDFKWAEFYVPISLTEEWLMKFGANKINHIHGYTFWTFHNTKQNNALIDVYVDERRTEFNSRGIKHCEYVHQLQNLYFALTGEELTLKSEL